MALDDSLWEGWSNGPVMAGAFGSLVGQSREHTLYEIEGHNAKDIGNSLHEGVMPLGKFEVIAPPVRERGKARAPIDARTILETDQVRVRLRRIAG